MKYLYCKAKFGEGYLGRGMGFGNRIFPWARCLLFSRDYNILMISPVWVRPALGQLIRGGVNVRSYLRQIILLGLFVKRPEDLGVLEGIIRSSGYENVNAIEGDVFGESDALEATQKKVIILFEGYQGNFNPLNGNHEYILKQLYKITRKKYTRWVQNYANVPIIMNIRCGNDFDTPEEYQKILKLGEKTPINWFLKCLNLIREECGNNVSAYIVSDGSRNQLEDLLVLPNVYFVRPASAISDLLILSKAKILLASGSSSFSAWGCFLGQMPCISHPGQDMSEWNIVPQKNQYIGEFDPNFPKTEILDEICQALRFDE